MRMTLLALPKPGPPAGAASLAAAFCRLKRLARLKPNTAEPPMRSSSRRVTPSHVSFPDRPGITSMDDTSDEGTTILAGQGADPTLAGGAPRGGRAGVGGKRSSILYRGPS